jgi:hypothetical protein
MILLSGQLKLPLFAIGIISSYAKYVRIVGSNYHFSPEITGQATAQLVCGGSVLPVKQNLSNMASNR